MKFFTKIYFAGALVLVCRAPCYPNVETQLPSGTTQNRDGSFILWWVPGADE